MVRDVDGDVLQDARRGDIDVAVEIYRFSRITIGAELILKFYRM